jgi:hypothetical protein
MISFAEWVPLVLVGSTFTLFACLKLYGLKKGVVGGPNKSLAVQLCGT